MNTPSSVLSHLTPSQHQALYDHARRQAAVLRREAMSDAAAWLMAQPRALWRAALRAVATHRTPQATACPR